MLTTPQKKKEIFALLDTVDQNDGSSLIICCCVKCVNFQVSLNTHLWQTSDIPDSLNVYDNMSTFGDGYEEEIFVGRLPNEFKKMNDETDCECDETINFPIRPCKKSCFTSSVLNYSHFCEICQDFYKEHLTEDLYVLYRNF